ncbi:hypothetical protein ACFMPD_06190 [Sedimentitalea sp. HM32M-2]|uniref:hypothetical protein n=1 Tax=Sedimentitalea sp. HM32M-2 TaxID=3351566 RepID=UPI003636A3B1
MSFVRPQARAAIWRWREVLGGAATLLLGLWWLAGPGGLLGWVGGALALAGGALCVVGLQRARFRAGGGGPGVVQVDEGQITYFGPLDGGAVAVEDLERLTLDASGKPAHWRLHCPGRAALSIPVNAEGAEALFDVFSTLPGLRTERMLAQMRTRSDRPVLIWRRAPQKVALDHRLH